MPCGKICREEGERGSDGVWEWWSVALKLYSIYLSMNYLHHIVTPILHHSSTPSPFRGIGSASKKTDVLLQTDDTFERSPDTMQGPNRIY